MIINKYITYAIFITIWLGLASQITACGQKGDLVLPETEQAKKAKKS